MLEQGPAVDGLLRHPFPNSGLAPQMRRPSRLQVAKGVPKHLNTPTPTKLRSVVRFFSPCLSISPVISEPQFAIMLSDTVKSSRTPPTGTEDPELLIPNTGERIQLGPNCLQP